MNVNIQVIPHSKQRYPTVGDWFYSRDWDRGNHEMGPQSLWTPIDVLEIRVSKMSDWRYETLVAVHELVEAVLCKVANVSQEDVDSFDMEFEKNRKPGDDREPGDQFEAPYARQHGIATGVERILATIMGVDWQAYEKELSEL